MNIKIFVVQTRDQLWAIIGIVVNIWVVFAKGHNA